MPIIHGLDRQQIRFSSLENAISADNDLRFIDTFVDKLDLGKPGVTSLSKTEKLKLGRTSSRLIRYFGVHSRWRLRGLFRHLDYRLAKWVKGKYKSIMSYQKAYNYLRKIQNSYPNLFYHWSIIGLG